MSDSPETHLWRAVIVQAIFDACLVVRRGKTKTIHAARSAAARFQRRTKARDEARRWLLRDTEDFRWVCHMAGLDPDAVRDEALTLERRGWPPVPKARHTVDREAA